MKYILIISGILLILGLIQIYYKFKKPIGPDTKTVEGFFGPFKRMIDGFKRIGRTISNFFKRFKNLGLGFKYGIDGTGLGIKNSAIITGLMFRDSFAYGFEAATYGYRWLMCNVRKLRNIHYCFIFYIFDLILYIIYIIVYSTAILLDAIFNIKRLFGYSLQNAFSRSTKSVRDLDKVIYSYSGIHITKYPTYIDNLCYKCSPEPNAKALDRRKNVLNDNFNRKFPKMIRPSIRKFEKSGQEFKNVFKPL
jgi:hypothetical protein